MKTLILDTNIIVLFGKTLLTKLSLCHEVFMMEVIIEHGTTESNSAVRLDLLTFLMERLLSSELL